MRYSEFALIEVPRRSTCLVATEASSLTRLQRYNCVSGRPLFLQAFAMQVHEMFKAPKDMNLQASVDSSDIFCHFDAESSASVSLRVWYTQAVI